MGISVSWIPALFLCSFIFFSVALAEEHSSVLSLDVSNFSKIVAKHAFVVVKFYTPLCGQCKKLAPEYEKAALISNKKDLPINFSKVDVSVELNEELANKFQLRGLPTLKIIRGGGRKINNYNGPREADGIVEYLKKQLGPASVEFKSDKEFTRRIENKEIFILGMFPEFSGEKFENFSIVADKRRTDYNFGHILKSEYLQHTESGVIHPLIKLFKPFDEPVVDFQDFHVDDLEKFIESASQPIVTTHDDDPRNQPYIEKFFDKENAKAMLYMRFSNGLIDSFRSKYQEVAKHYKTKNISFLIGNLDSSQGFIILQLFGVREDQVPFLLIQRKENEKYLVPNIKPDQITTSLQDYTDGHLKRFIKSEPIPNINYGPVKVVVASNFHEVVFDSGKNVLIEFYIPHCKRCRSLAPILDQVATSFRKDADVILTKMDLTENDIPNGFEIDSLPSLYFSSANHKRVRYEGDGTREDIISFIEKNRDVKATQHNNMNDEL